MPLSSDCYVQDSKDLVVFVLHLIAVFRLDGSFTLRGDHCWQEISKKMHDNMLYCALTCNAKIVVATSLH